MQRHLFFFLLGRIAILNGLAFFVPLLASVWWGERGYVYFGPSIFITLGVGAAFVFFGRKHNKYLGVAGGAWYMVLVWALLGIIGMLPYVLSGALAAADAFFESVSAFTTVGLSCLDYSGGDFTFTPRSMAGAKNPPLKDRLCHGRDLRGIDDETIISRGLDLEYVIDAYRNLSLGEAFFTPMFEKLIGVDYVRKMIIEGCTAEEIRAEWQPDVERFRQLRRKYLLYDE